MTNQTFGGLLCCDAAFFVHQHFGSPNIPRIHIQHLYPEDGNSMFIQSLDNQIAGYKNGIVIFH
jgi:hypothetical protein